MTPGAALHADAVRLFAEAQDRVRSGDAIGARSLLTEAGGLRRDFDEVIARLIAAAAAGEPISRMFLDRVPPLPPL